MPLAPREYHHYGGSAGKAREEASSAAFRDVDMLEIEEAWREFTLELKAPK